MTLLFLMLLLLLLLSLHTATGWITLSPLQNCIARRRWLLPCLHVGQNFFNDDIGNNEVDDEDNLTEELSDEELAATMGEWDDQIARFNTVHLTGRIGNDPEPRYFDDGKVVVNLSLACKRKYHFLERKALGIQSGEEETDWYGLEIWGQTAEFVSKFVDRGMRVGVVGSLQVDEWVDKESGEKRMKVKVIVSDFDILESRAEGDLRRSGKRGPSSYGDDNGNGGDDDGSRDSFF